jgi:hypothetical protein
LIVIWSSCIEPKVIKSYAGGSCCREGGWNVQASVGTKHNPRRIHYEKIGIATRNLNDSVNYGGIATVNAGKDVLDSWVGDKVCYLAFCETKLAEAVEKICSRGLTASDVEAIARRRYICCGCSGLVGGSGHNGLCPS